MLRFLLPDVRVSCVQALTVQWLRERGIDALLLDADCTLKRYRSEECEPTIYAWLAGLRGAGIGLCLVSNGLGPRIERFAGRVGLPFVAKALKPLPLGCWRAIRTHGFKPSRTAMVGDQLFADVLAGRLAKLTTILVEPIHPEEEPWFTRLKRRPERFLLRRAPEAPRGRQSLNEAEAPSGIAPHSPSRSNGWGEYTSCPHVLPGGWDLHLTFCLPKGRIRVVASRAISRGQGVQM